MQKKFILRSWKRVRWNWVNSQSEQSARTSYQDKATRWNTNSTHERVARGATADSPTEHDGNYQSRWYTPAREPKRLCTQALAIPVILSSASDGTLGLRCIRRDHLHNKHDGNYTAKDFQGAILHNPPVEQPPKTAAGTWHKFNWKSSIQY